MQGNCPDCRNAFTKYRNCMVFSQRMVCLHLFNSRKRLYISKEELEQLCAEFPKDLMMCCWAEDKNTIVADDLTKPAELWRYELLRKEQDGKNFYSPETSVMEDFYRNGYPAGQEKFRKLGRMMECGCRSSGDGIRTNWREWESGVIWRAMHSR